MSDYKHKIVVYKKYTNIDDIFLELNKLPKKYIDFSFSTEKEDDKILISIFLLRDILKEKCMAYGE